MAATTPLAVWPGFTPQQYMSPPQLSRPATAEGVTCLLLSMIPEPSRMTLRLRHSWKLTHTYWGGQMPMGPTTLLSRGEGWGEEGEPLLEGAWPGL